MSSTTGEIQPVASVARVAPETQIKEVQPVPPVTRTEGGSATKAGDFGASSGANFPAPSPEFSAEVVQQLQSFLKENMGIEAQLHRGRGRQDRRRGPGQQDRQGDPPDTARKDFPLSRQDRKAQGHSI